MSFTNQNIGQMVTGLKQAAGALLTPQDVNLYPNDVDVVQIKLHVGQRRAASPDLTPGMERQNQYATIDAADWDAKAGRMPQRGDVIHWAGRRYAVEDCQIIAPAGQVSFYKARLNG